MATRDNASLPAVAKQQRQRSDSGGSTRFTAESHSLHLAGIDSLTLTVLFSSEHYFRLFVDLILRTQGQLTGFIVPCSMLTLLFIFCIINRIL